MKILIASPVLLGLLGLLQAAPQSSPQPVPLDIEWLPSRGKVSASASGRRLDLSIGEVGSNKLLSFNLDALPAGARVLAARVGPWMGSAGIVVAIAVETGASTEYRIFLSRTLAADDGFLSEPLFTSTGEPYRIVDAHNPGGGDALEITFRRGWPDLQGPETKVDEKVFFDPCGGYWPQMGRTGLYEVAEVRRAR